MRKNIERDDQNLIVGLDYTFDENGKIQWRKLIKNEYLVPNKDRTQETDVSKLEDKDILVLLGGFKELADIHGYTKVSYKFPVAQPDFVSCICRIDFIPSYNTEMRQISFESCADASHNNTQSIGGKYFLTTTAENRAFVRAVRNFLRINILAKDELVLGAKNQFEEQAENNPASPKNAVLDKMKKMGFTSFKEARVKFEEINILDYKGFETLNDVPGDKMMGLMMNLNKLKK
jgi:hypothetical protein